MKPPDKFGRCLFNPMEDDLTGKYQRLKELMDRAYRAAKDIADEDVSGQFNITADAIDDKMLRYIILLYDPGSPMQKLFPDLEERKRESAKLAGYTDDRTTLEELYSCQNDVIVIMIIEYLKLVASREWAIIVSYEQVIWELNQRMILMVKGSLADKDKDLIGAVNMKPKMARDVIEMNDTLTSLLKKFYGEDEIVTRKAQKMRAETVAFMTTKPSA